MVRVRLNCTVLVAILLLNVVTISILLPWLAQTKHTTTPPSSSSSSSSSGSFSRSSGPSLRQLLTRGKVHVLLVSSWRSGSSFLGQVFSQNPSVFYLMEPGWHVWRKLHMAGALELRMAVRDLLRQVLKCDMSVMESYMGPHAKTNHLFFWSHSRALCSSPLCNATAPGAISNQTECQRHCRGKPLDSAADACSKHYSHVVLKTVRIFELESLYPLLRDPTLDLRIVHLVRDPRAVWRSRRWVNNILAGDSHIVLQHGDVKGMEADVSVMETICRSHVHIYQTVQHAQAPDFLRGRYKMVRYEDVANDPLGQVEDGMGAPDFLRGRYKMVRYEDVANDPLGQVEDIYRFVGLNMTQELQSWIHLSTSRKSAKTDPFKTMSRNAKDVSLAWRTSLPYDQVKRVQAVCKYAMYLYGYRTVDSNQDQRDLERDVVLPLESVRFKSDHMVFRRTNGTKEHR
ncbi:carbohydrate sulfotransferase 5-like [Engraulis encrasicolus]|uniref:carbohydrate sulfotransferase 5-like n=1 Tax=Engraulis encrasicolus TaxID=184585 RepID=UPI002FD78695